jgi:hypothetical protein
VHGPAAAAGGASAVSVMRVTCHFKRR